MAVEYELAKVEPKRRGKRRTTSGLSVVRQAHIMARLTSIAPRLATVAKL